MDFLSKGEDQEDPDRNTGLMGSRAHRRARALALALTPEPLQKRLSRSAESLRHTRGVVHVAMYGMDIEEVRTLSTQLQQASSDIHNIVAQLTGKLQGTTWVGPDRAEIRGGLAVASRDGAEQCLHRTAGSLDAGQPERPAAGGPLRLDHPCWFRARLAGGRGTGCDGRVSAGGRNVR